MTFSKAALAVLVVHTELCKNLKNNHPKKAYLFLLGAQFVTTLFKLLKFLHHFRINFLKNFILTLKKGKKSRFYGRLVRNNFPLNFLKIYVIWQCIFE